MSSPRTLAEVLADGPPSPEESASIGAGVARALAALHREERVHGAVCPENVRIGSSVTLDETVAGAAPYLAPEGPVDARSDVYALGVLLYRMLAGAPPAGVDPIPPIQAAVPATLEYITRRALHPVPAERYRDVVHVALALEAWLALRVRPPPAPTPVARSIPRTLAAAASMAVGGALIAVGAVGIGASWWAGRAPPAAEEIAPPSALVAVDGVRFEAAHAERALAFVNTASAEALAAAGVYDRGVDAVVAHRPFSSLEAFGELPGIGAKTVEAIAAATR